MGGALRVLQAADLKLHEPLESVGSLTGSLRELFNQARERTALKIFNAALAQQVDLLLLTGTLADFEAEPRLAYFLMEQFRLLNAAGISIVWATEKSSLLPIWSLRPEHLSCLLPGQSAVVYSGNSSKQVLIHHAQHGLSTGNSGGTLRADSRDLIITVETSAVGNMIEYRGTGLEAIARYEIIPTQHSGPHQTSPSGVRLVEALPGHKLQTTLLPVHTVRWVADSIDVGEHFSIGSLQEELTSRSMSAHPADEDHLVCFDWTLTGTGPLWETLVEDRNAEEFLFEIRESLPRDARVWTRRIRFQPSAEQFQLWSECEAMAEGLRQLEQLSTADLAASANIPAAAGTFLRGPTMIQNEFARYRTRLARELRNGETIPSTKYQHQ